MVLDNRATSTADIVETRYIENSDGVMLQTVLMSVLTAVD